MVHNDVKEIAKRTAQTQTNTCRHPHSWGYTSDMKLSMTGICSKTERERGRNRNEGQEEGWKGNAERKIYRRTQPVGICFSMYSAVEQSFLPFFLHYSTNCYQACPEGTHGVG